MERVERVVANTPASIALRSFFAFFLVARRRRRWREAVAPREPRSRRAAFLSDLVMFEDREAEVCGDSPPVRDATFKMGL